MLPLHVRPLVEGFGAKDFAELFHGVFLLREGRSLVLTSITNATPAVEQNVQVFAFLVDNLHVIEKTKQQLKDVDCKDLLQCCEECELQ